MKNTSVAAPLLARLFHLLILSLVCAVPVSSFAQSYPVDANGWSILTPSADSRLVYVSATGNDSTAQTYTTAQVGSNPSNPSISVNAYQTLATARNQMRVGYPDWILFRRGDTFTDVANFGGNSVGGRSGTERWVFTHYGSTGNRPLLTGAYWSLVGTSGNMAIVGLDIHYRTRDPKSPFWVGFSSQERVIFTAVGPIIGNLLFEDSLFRNAADNISMDMDNGVSIDVRRCAIWEGYKGTTTLTDSAGANADRSQGIYVAGSSGLRIEDCFFDHNGWVTDTSGNLVGYGRSIYSHNIYLANGSNNTMVVGNIIARGAANGLQARAGNYIEDNLFLLNAIGGFSAAYPGESVGDEGSTNDFLDNVFIAGTDILPSAWVPHSAGPRGWGMEVHRMEEGHYQGNILLDVRDQSSSSWAINCVFNLTSGPETIKVWNNIVRNWQTSSGASILVQSGAASHFDLQNNIVDGVNQTTGQPVTFADGSRTLSTYLSSIGSSGDNLTFLANARAAWSGAPRSYPANYRASTVNNYFRAGFTIGGGTPSATISATDASAAEPSNNGQFTVTLSPAPSSNVTVNLSRSGTATNGTDYTSFPLTVTVGTGGSATIPVMVTNDSTVESTETVILTLATGTGYSVGSPNAATVNITDDDGSGGLPSPWLTQDIGAVGATGTAAHASGTFTIEGSGADIWSTADEFRYVYQAASGDCTIVARVTGVENTDASAKVGVMIRKTLNTDSMYALLSVKPNGGLEFLRRTTAGGSTSVTSVSSTLPRWVRLVRSGNTLTASHSSDGSTWTTVGSESITMGTSVYIGMAVNSHNDGTLCTGTFTNVTATPGTVTPVVSIVANDAAAAEPSNNGQYTVTLSPAPASNVTVNLTRTGTATNGTDYTSIPTTVSVGTSGTATINVTVTNDTTAESTEAVILTLASGSGYTVGSPNSATVNITDDELPSPWLTQDVGAVGATGTVAHASGTFTIEGSGADIWGTTDEFRYVYHAASGDCTIVARVTGVENTDASAKVGVMIRTTLNADSIYALLSIKPAGGLEFLRRTTTGGSSSVTTASSSLPRWVRLVRSGNTITASHSSDGSTWTTVGSETITMGTNVYIGMAVNSHNDGTLCTGTFTNVTATP